MALPYKAGPVWLEAGLARSARLFWETAGEASPYPRSMEDAAPLALPVSISYVAGLAISHVNALLQEHGFPPAANERERRMRGCLLAYAGYGLILIDASDPVDEQRFTLAHEVAHFIVDYLESRARVVGALGPGIVPVLDGERAPTPDEKVQAVLGEVSLGLHLDLMERNSEGGHKAHRVVVVERRADRLALELLAPAEQVWDDLAAGAQPNLPGWLRHATALLRDRYGLPQEQAAGYARWMLHKAGVRQSSFRRWLDL